MIGKVRAKGSVTDRLGKPIPFAKIIVTDDTGIPVADLDGQNIGTITDDDGNFVVGGRQIKPYHLPVADLEEQIDRYLSGKPTFYSMILFLAGPLRRTVDQPMPCIAIILSGSDQLRLSIRYLLGKAF